jgi:hypothetical protein
MLDRRFVSARGAQGTPRGFVRLERRGVRHGFARDDGRHDVDSMAGASADARARWRAARPLVLRGVLEPALSGARREVASTLALFDCLRRGADFQAWVWRRLGGDPAWTPAGASVDLGDEREILKVFAHARARGGRAAARDLYAKLSWIAHDPRDRSLRIRFSFGAEQLFDWRHETRRAPHADLLAEALFPECAVLTEQVALRRWIEALAGTAVRYSERIVYNNAPSGGAVLHHDAEPNQLGVLYGQLEGATAWLALPKRELGQVLRESGRARTVRGALARLDRESDGELMPLLNHTPAFTRELVERGAFLVLRKGDALILPSPGWNDCCWHAVFALGRRASLAHSYGLFALRRTRTAAPAAPRPRAGRERDG